MLGQRLGHIFQFELLAFAQRVSVDVHAHRNHLVIACRHDDIDHAALAYQVLQRAERRVAHVFRLVQLGDEVVNGFFVRRHAGGPPSFGDGFDLFFAESGLRGRAPVSLPFEVRSPVTRGEQDGDFFKLVGNGHVEADALPHVVKQRARIGAAHDDVEAASGPAAGGHGLRHLLLGGVHLLIGERLEAISGQSDRFAFDVCGYGGRGGCSGNRRGEPRAYQGQRVFQRLELRVARPGRADNDPR